MVGEAINQTGDNWLLPEVHRVRGELLLRSGRDSDVEECFGRALKAAQAQSARLLELRAAMSLARFWRDQGKLREAGELLAPGARCMSNVRKWLEAIGLAQYGDIFESCCCLNGTFWRTC
jgi:predicted ATPase